MAGAREIERLAPKRSASALRRGSGQAERRYRSWVEGQPERKGRIMGRHILDESRIHPAILAKVAGNHADIVQQVQEAIATHAVVVVGMAGNPFPKKARRELDRAGVKFHYLEYGSYLSEWRRRNALKMWTGWPTFPMVFVKGMLVGGADDLAKLVASGELKRMLS
jgi:monothiol glutaredoxin